VCDAPRFALSAYRLALSSLSPCVYPFAPCALLLPLWPFALSPLPFATMRPHFRFEDLEIWQLAAQMAVKFHRVADRLSDKRLHRYAEQLRGAGLSLSNNIAEGSGSSHAREFQQFLNISRRSLFEDASMIMVFEKLGILEGAECDLLSRKITAFSRTLGP